MVPSTAACHRNCQVELAETGLFDEAAEDAGTRCALGEDGGAGCAAVETVHGAEFYRGSTIGQKLFSHVGECLFVLGGPVHRQPRGLVDDDNPVILEEDVEGGRLSGHELYRPVALLEGDCVPRDQESVGGGREAVDGQMPSSDKFAQVSERSAWEEVPEEALHRAAVVGFGNGQS